MTQGWSGRRFWIVREGERLAAVRTKSVAFETTAIDRSDEEYDGWRHLDPRPDSRGVTVNVTGLAAPRNWALLNEDWLGKSFTDIHVVFPEGTVLQARDGAFLRSLDYVGEHKGAVMFTAAFSFSGLIETVQPILLTSRPYGLELIDAMTAGARLLDARFSPVTIEAMEAGAALLDGTLAAPLVVYDDWPAEDVDIAAALLDGTLAAPIVVYENWPPDELEAAASLLDGTIETALIRYEEWPAEQMDATASLLDGTLV